MIKTNHFSLLAIWFIIGLLLSGCNFSHNSDSHFEEIARFEKSPDGNVVFYPFQNISSHQIIDSANIAYEKYNLFVEVRYSEKCSIKNLPLDMECLLPPVDSISKLKVSIPLFDENDNVSGKGNYGVYESKVEIFSDISPDPDAFVSVSTPEKNLDGIIAIGVVCEKINLLQK